MKVKIAIITGLIMACPSMLLGGEASGTAEGSGRPAETKAAVAFQTIIWTNNLDLHESGNSFRSEGYSSGTLPEVIMEYGDMTVSNEYQVIAVYRSDETFEFIDIDTEITATVITNGSLPDLRDASEFFRWKYGADNVVNSGHGRKTPMQILIIEPLDPGKDFTPERIRIQEYRFDATQPETAWHAWLNPRLFLLKWADYWSSGTDAAPVALLIITF